MIKVYRQEILTPIGNMETLIGEKGLYYLGFKEGKKYNSNSILFGRGFQIIDFNIDIECSKNIILYKNTLAIELEEYFLGKRKSFSLPLVLEGTPFQKKVWQELKNIPYGKTISYRELAIRIGNKNSARAVGNANGLNNIIIILPCHRVILSNGKLGGYNGGEDKKLFLLELEYS